MWNTLTSYELGYLKVTLYNNSSKNVCLSTRLFAFVPPIAFQYQFSNDVSVFGAAKAVEQQCFIDKSRFLFFNEERKNKLK